MADIAKFIEEIKGMTVMELNSLVKAIEEEFGVSAAAVVAAGPAAGAEAAPAAEEKTEFNVVLKEIGAEKVKVIKAVKDITGAGLIEAKGLVEKCGVIKENVAKEEAEKMVEALKAAGATAVLE
ncbi:MAG: 50S ribosomal protein L7/L12 [Clostridia bacterium]|nr:50S ribosomal protein L7/L12 [Clostridia bacterium]MBQ4099015.1 50S ribosomal protein L7/L12 [Clostridia bacterium]